MDQKKLFLIDAYAMIYRAYYALIRSPRFNVDGLNTSAIFGFCNTVDQILRKENPTHIAVCFDPPGGHTFRHELYPEYKAQRDKQPEDITLSIPYIKEILRGLNIEVIEVDGFEADDVIGTLARRAENEGFTTYMMTPDKDYGQLVTDRIFMYRPATKGQDFEIRGPKQVVERYGISSPSQVIDLLALEGDASDNVPGCPGVGEKTAAKLIREFGSVENLLANTDRLKGAQQRNIIDNADQILFSKQLVTIKTDVPVDISIDSLRRRAEDPEILRNVFTKLEFKTFLERYGLGTASKKDTSSAPSTENPDLGGLFAQAESQAASDGNSLMGSLFDIPEEQSAAAVAQTTIVTVDTQAAFAEFIRKAAAEPVVGLAVYAVGESTMTATLQGIALAIPGGETAYAELPDAEDRRAEYLAALQPLLDNPSVLVVSHSVKEDYILLRRNGVSLDSPYFDTSVAHYLLEPEKRHGLADLARIYLRTELPDRTPRGKLAFPDYGTAAADEFTSRASISLALHTPLAAALAENGLTALFDDIETPFVKVLANMEMAGVRIDVNELATQSVKLTERLHEMERRCYELAGQSFNIGSPRQVGEILFEKMKIDPKAKRTKTGAFSTTEEILEKFAHDYEIVDLILKIRGVTKLLATYINALPALINPATGKIHTTYNQTVTATGRISSTNPNLQNIPIRTDDGREIRRAFIPDPGNLMMSADYSQIELRLMADMSGDPDLVAAFREGSDIHRLTASKIYKLPLEEVTDSQRRNAKTANFGIIYGISAFGLSERLGIPRSEAKMLIDGYFESYPSIRQYIADSVENARANGFVATIMGRKRYLPDINSRNNVVRSYAERNAVNAPIQGSAADIIKIAMIRIDAEMQRRGLRSSMILQVHDELVFNVIPEELPDLQELVTREMENAYNGRVRLEVASGVGSNWLEAH